MQLLSCNRHGLSTVPNDKSFGSLLGYHTYSWCITGKPTFQKSQNQTPLGFSLLALFCSEFLFVVFLQPPAVFEEALLNVADDISASSLYTNTLDVARR